MQRRSFLKSIGIAALGLLAFKLPIQATTIPDFAAGASIWTRIHDRLFYRPWTDEELAERVARSVANTGYRCWHNKNVYAKIPLFVARPGGYQLETSLWCQTTDSVDRQKGSKLS